MYPELVKVFYSNLKYKDACLFSKVKKVQIVIDRGLFYQFTGLSFDGETLLRKGTTPDDWKEDYNHDLALAQFIGEGDTTNKRNLVDRLSLEDCILHYILVCVLIPRAGNYAQISSDDVLVMWAMTTERPINWGYYIIQHMLKVKKKARCALLYGMLITRFFQHFHIPVCGEVTLDETPHYPINEGTMTKMEFKNYAGQWYIPNKHGGDAPSPTSPSHPAPAFASASIPPPPSNFMAVMLEEF